VFWLRPTASPSGYNFIIVKSFLNLAVLFVFSSRVKSYKQFLSGGEFKWSLGVRGADAESFFAPQDDSGKLLAEKRKWLDESPERYLASTNEADPLTQAVWKQALAWGHVEEPEGGRSLRNLAERWEADFMLVNKATMKMVAGAVCFPSSWDLRTAIGKPVFSVHEVVPQLNEQVGNQVDRFLNGIRGGKSYARMNWSLTRTNELNYHPGLNRKKLDATVTLEELFLRIEQQLFCEVEGGVLMGLRIEPVPLMELAEDPDLWNGLREKIRTMPDEVAKYKSMLSARDVIVDAMGRV
jgi:hypothetical protein